jgi:hypothetical protein
MFTGLEYLFLLRYNLLLLGVFHAIIWLSLKPWSPLAPMIGGMFELTPRRAGSVAAGAAMFACEVVLMSDMVLQFAPHRFGVAEAPEWPFYAIASLASLGVLGLAVRLVREGFRPLGNAIWVTVGIVFAVGVAWGVDYVKDFLPFQDLLTRLFRISKEGYLDVGGQIFSTHSMLFYVGLSYLIAYLLVGLWMGNRIKNFETLKKPVPIPALGWVMALLMLSALVLNALSFFFDKFHVALVPVALVAGAVLYATVGRLYIESHTYRAFLAPEERTKAVRPQPAEVLGRAESGKAVVICASGGGIHAAAWSAALLEEMERRSAKFAKHLVLTSSVSGGSVGCLFYLAGLRAAKRPAPGRLLEVACESSLSHIAWGLAFRDLLRYFVPIGAALGWGNRAWALEKAWRRFEDFPVHTSLGEWERDVAAGKLPASVFNATLVETGDRFAISTVDLVDREKDQELRREFHHLYPGLEIRATTAAGLSAAFPVVSPSSQIWVHPKEDAMPHPDKRYHITDGGFYDNYGVVSAIEFLEKGRVVLRDKMPEVMVIRIRGAVGSVKAASPNSFFFQMMAPLKALVNMRSASQAVRNDVELKLLDQVTNCLETADFPYPYPYEPLTWHLTQAQKDEIRKAVQHPSIREQLDRVERFLSPGAGCAANA